MTSQELTKKRILFFMLPLASTWLMMSLEGPYLAALIARMAEPKFNLAAYGIAFSFAMMIEAPIIMMMSASNALVQNRQSFYALRNFTYSLNFIITVIMLVLLIPGIFYFLLENLMGLSVEVCRLTHTGLILLIPWPAAIGYRRFYQGILIRNKLTKYVAYGTVIRLASMSVTGLSLFIFSKYPGIVIGATALSVGVICEAAASRIMVSRIIKLLKEQTSTKELSLKEIISFYYPLALTSMLNLGIHPMITFFLSQSRYAIESLAVLPVINSFLFVFKSPGFAYQEVGIALLNSGFKAIRNFALYLGVILSIVLSIIAFTPLSGFWFTVISGLSRELSSFAMTPLMILVIMPFFEVILNFQRAVLVNSRYTKPITFATILEITGILISLFLIVKFTFLSGAIAASISFVIGRAVSIFYLVPEYNKTVSLHSNHRKF